MADYLPMQAGKYRTYQLDSTVFTNFGTSIEVRSYQEKHVVDAVITEGGKTGYRVFRYIRKNAADAWKSSGSYSVSINGNAEVTENNMRIIKLAAPVKASFKWRGNTYLPEKPYSAIYLFNNDDEMHEWDFTYTDVGETLTLNGKTYQDVITVTAVDESINIPVTSNQQYAERSLSVEKYAKGVGLIYQELILFEYQPISAYRPGYTGFGVKRTLTDHN